MVAATVSGWMVNGVCLVFKYPVEKFLEGVWEVFRRVILDPIRLGFACCIHWAGSSLIYLARKLGDERPSQRDLKVIDLTNENHNLQERIEKLRQSEEVFQKKMSFTQAELQQIHENHVKQSEQLQWAQEENVRLAEQNKNGAVEKKSLQLTISALREEISQLGNSVQKEKNQISTQEQSLEEICLHKAQLGHKVYLLKEELKDISEKYEEMRCEHTSWKQRAEEMRKARDCLSKELDTLRGEAMAQRHMDTCFKKLNEEPNEYISYLIERKNGALKMLREAFARLAENHPCRPSILELIAVLQDEIRYFSVQCSNSGGHV